MPFSAPGFILAALLAATMLASAAEEASRTMFTRVWRSHDGMPGNEVTGVAQDGSGYLWIAYLNAMAKFDGVQFQTIELPLPPEHGFNIRSILRTSGDRFWIALDGGKVVCIAPGKTNVLTTADALPDARPISMAETRDGVVWIGYSDGSICRVQGNRVTRLASRNGLAAGRNCRLASDIKGNLWIAQGTDVGIWRGDQFEKLLSFSEKHVRIARARGGGIWICADSRVMKFHQDGGIEDFAQMQPKGASIAPEVLLEDRSGALWVGTFGQGVFRCTATNTESVETSQRTILNLFEDREGSIWVGTAGAGLNRIRPRVLELHEMDNGLPFETARSICVDGSGKIWAVGRNGALARLDNGNWRQFGKKEGWPGELATCTTSDAEGAVWVGTYRRGTLYRWQNGAFTKWNRDSGLGGSSVRLLFGDSSSNLWIGLVGPSGLQRFKDGKFQRFNEGRSQLFSAAAEDIAGNVWFGTTAGKLFRVAGDRLIDETHRALHPPRSITCLQTTSDGSLWIGYLGGGIGRLRAEGFQHIAPEQGVPNGRICDIVPDDRGSFWLSTDQGIFRVSQTAMRAVAERVSSNLDAIYYGSDELLSLQGFSPYFPGAARSHGGNILFPLFNGLAVVHPDRFPTNHNPPQVIIESVSADNRLVAFAEKDQPLRFQPGLRKLEFQFTAPAFIAPSSIRFRHQLQGVDKDWIDLGTQRRVTYTRLPPGHYSFRVTACNYAGVWNDIGDKVSFEILPFFWQTTAFKITCIALIPIAFYGGIRYIATRRLRQELRRLQQEAALNRERARIAKDIHDDLGASLTQISLLSELATRHLQPTDTVGHHVKKLAQTARQAFTSLDEIVWAVNPRNDTLAHLLDYLAQFALEFFSSTQVRCRIDFPTQPPEFTVSSEMRHTLYLVVREALNNVAKHAQATEVHVRATLIGAKLQLAIEDDGIGFDFPGNIKPEADGLANMRQRIEEIGGKFNLISRIGSGTVITIEIPLAREKISSNLTASQTLNE